MKEQTIAVSVKSLKKDFVLPHERYTSIKERVLSFKKPTYEKFHALKNINLQIKKGEFVGIVGRNGSGKSTLLKILGGIYQPTAGEVKVEGTLTPFIELGIGFNPELTGRENVFLNGAILGLTHKQVKNKYQEIVDFAELEKFMDQKLKNYSSGMQVRLAFSIAVQAHNEILLIDEVLAVGDASFQKKCFTTFKEIKKSGKTVVFVTHDMSAVEEYCDRAVLIENGVIASSGSSKDVARDYRNLMNDAKLTGKENKDKLRVGTGAASIEKLSFSTEDLPSVQKLKEHVKRFNVSLKVKFNADVERPIFGITVRDSSGTPLFLSNTKASHIATKKYKKGDTAVVTWELQNVFNTGKYSVTPAVAAENAITILDSRDDFAWLIVEKDTYLPGPIYFDHKIGIK